MKSLLAKKQIATKLKSLKTDWELSKTGTSIIRKYPFRSYLSGLMFVTKVSVHAQVALHFPEITLSEKFVKITLSTTEIKGLSNADFDLAAHFDSLYNLSTTSKWGAHNHY